MKTKKLFALLLAALMMFGVFAACNNDTSNPSSTSSESSAPASSSSEESSGGSEASEPSTSNTGTGKYPGTTDADMITVDIGTEPPEVNSVLTTDTIGLMLVKNTMENLVKMDEQDEVIPGAAETWDISEDKLTYTFHLREGMVWSNGDPVTAADFAFAWKEVVKPENAAEYAYFIYPIVGAKEYNEGTGSADDVKVTAVDDLTLEVVLTQPTEYFLSALAFGTMAPVNQKFYEEVGADKYGTEAEYTLSNGPFKITAWTHESEIMLEKNEDYFDADTVQIPKIKMVMILDTNAKLNAFKAGETDMTNLTLGTQSQQIEAEGYEVLRYNDGGSFYLEMNLKVDALANKNIRKAIAYAIDREAFIATVFQNSSQPATSLVAPSIMGKSSPFPEEITSPIPAAGDTEKAVEFFEAGLAELNMTAAEVSAQLTMITDDGDAAITMGAFIQEQLRSKLGLEITVENMPFKSRIERMQNKDFSLVFAGWSADYNDPNSYLDLFVTDGGNNHTSYSNPEYDKLVSDAAAELDPDKRMDIFYQIEEIIAEDCMVAPVYWRIRDYVVSEKVGGIYRTALQDMMFRNAYIK